jgi:rRNA maturation RNase YbeY
MPPVSRPVIALFNRQRDRPVSLPALRRWIHAALSHLHRDAEIGVHLVDPTEMARVNWDFLRHEGSTDVITFDHGSSPDRLHGELFISIADAVSQAARFHTDWQEELGRYVVHGLLHLCGEDDLEPAARRRMKRQENQLVRTLAQSIPPASLERRRPSHG